MAILAMVSTQTARRSRSPLAVSPDNIMQSAPSKIELATSIASALEEKYLIKLEGQNLLASFCILFHNDGYLPGGPGLLDHGFEHLGGADDGLAKLVALGEHLFLGDQHLLCGDLNANDAPGNHGAVITSGS